MKCSYLTFLFVFGCSLSGCAGELKAAKSGGRAVPFVIITVQCEQEPDSSTCTVDVSPGDRPVDAQQDSDESEDSASQ